MRIPTIALYAALAAALASPLVGPVGAEEPAADPAAAFAQQVAALPAPSTALGFRFQGVVQVNGRRLGHALFEAAPGGEGGAQWVATDRMTLKPGATAQIETAVAVLGRDLTLASGTVRTNKPGDGGIAWSRTAKGFRASRTTVRGPASEENVRNFEHAGSALNTLAATILFLRSALPGEGTYATSIFEVEEGLDGKPAIEAVMLTVLGPQKLQGKDVLAATGVKGAKELTVLFHPESHAVIGVRLTEGEMTLQIVAADMWSLPARDAKTAAMRAGLALSTGDVTLLDDVLHWPSLYAQALEAGQAGPTDEPLSLEAYRTSLLKKLATTLPKNPPAMMRQVVTNMRASLTEQALPGGRVQVTYPPMFKALQVTVAEIDGVWSLVKLPGAPRPTGGGDGAPK